MQSYKVYCKIRTLLLLNEVTRQGMVILYCCMNLTMTGKFSELQNDPAKQSESKLPTLLSSPGRLRHAIACACLSTSFNKICM